MIDAKAKTPVEVTPMKETLVAGVRSTFVDGLRPALLAVAVVTAIGVAAVNRFRGTMAGSGQAAGTEVRVSECEPAS